MKKLLFAMLLFSCGSPDPQPKITKLPKVQTILNEITKEGIIVSLKVTGEFSSSGFCWAETEPNLDSPFSVGETDTIQLPFRKTYYIRAYARNGAGLAYGNTLEVFNICPSSLGGNVDYVTTGISTSGDPCSSVSGKVYFEPHGKGVYGISDISFGVYACSWGDSPAVGVEFVDTCGEFIIQGHDQYGLEYVWTYSVSGDNLTVNWHNDFGDAGTTVLTRAGGW